jgi:hypothetical protein
MLRILVFSYSYKNWPGKAEQPTREPFQRCVACKWLGWGSAALVVQHSLCGWGLEVWLVRFLH